MSRLESFAVLVATLTLFYLIYELVSRPIVVDLRFDEMVGDDVTMQGVNGYG